MDDHNTLTPKDVLDLAVNELMNINVPIGLIPQIGTPIQRTVGILNELKKAYAENEKKQSEKEKAEIVDVGVIEGDVLDG